MKKILKHIKDELLFASLFPESVWHLVIKREMNDACLSDYFIWVMTELEKDGYFGAK